VITAVGRTGDGATDLAGFRGLGRTKPALALGMTVLLLAQAGVPLTSGFVAKFGVIGDGVRTHSYALALIAMVSAVIAAFLYLRIMISMWIAEPEQATTSRSGAPVLGLAITAAGSPCSSVLPGLLIEASEHATIVAIAAVVSRARVRLGRVGTGTGCRRCVGRLGTTRRRGSPARWAWCPPDATAYHPRGLGVLTA
jgi:NADH-quinone oxidoreductase subunit N